MEGIVSGFEDCYFKISWFKKERDKMRKNEGMKQRWKETETEKQCNKQNKRRKEKKEEGRREIKLQTL